MAQVRRVGQDLEVRLTVGEKIAALRGDLRVPLSAVTAVDVVTEPLAAVTGARAPGLGLPGRAKIGTWRQRGRRTFAVARAHVPAVRIALSGQRDDVLIVSLPDAEAVAASLRAPAQG
ncbi:hypothetical protein E4P42_09930 [Mycobacterium sp. PS03-16]|uniref:hypothetical protein n=1 Tax=Mycobacterium sp. PS03-16 TaxID=2559611 RepID=UPI001073F4AC|nr:hypothetical protein [Mycobacterium sp. PS03-16]TFV58815.1 hypothetical protein E4P42_09930 [Mycobacterium sp. PS03-16]